MARAGLMQMRSGDLKETLRPGAASARNRGEREREREHHNVGRRLQKNTFLRPENLATCLQSVPSVRRRCISVSGIHVCLFFFGFVWKRATRNAVESLGGNDRKTLRPQLNLNLILRALILSYGSTKASGV